MWDYLIDDYSCYYHHSLSWSDEGNILIIIIMVVKIMIITIMVIIILKNKNMIIEILLNMVIFLKI